MKKFFKRTGLLLAAAFIGAAAMQAQKSPQDMDRFIDALMKRMTVEEKIGQLNLPVTGEITTGQAKSSDVAKKIEQGLVGGLFNLKGVDKIRDVQKLAVENSRLGIPLLFGMDVIHGYETIFPIPLGLSCTWDMAAIRESARIAAIEASADGISWTFSPMVDISRDPRWGRVSEGSGEAPFLGGAIAKAMVYGYQGANLSEQLRRNDEILACVKHFALYGAGEAGRDYNTVDMSRNRMFNEYMYPYEAAVDAGVGSVMASFNEIDGVPATANKWLMTDVLRKQWGFNGFVVTDFTGISEMTEHGIGDLQAVSARALNAGVDMDMVSEGFVGTLKKSVMSGKVSMKTLDTACRRILEAKYKLGLFDNPYKYCDPERPARDIFTKEHRAAARRIAAESFVLLKNGSIKQHPGSLPEPLLPLKKEGTVAVIGPLGNTRSNMPGTWSVAARLNDYPSLYEGLKEMMSGKVNVTYAKGSNLIGDAAYEERATMFGRSLNRDNRTDKELLDEALKTAAGADVIAGSFIKNPGGGITPTGGYIAGKADLVEKISHRFTAPGIGKDLGCTQDSLRDTFLGFYYAPGVVCEALKTAVYAQCLLELVGVNPVPRYTADHNDIVTCFDSGSAAALQGFCAGIQSCSPVDSFVSPEPADEPGYTDQVIMASGSFTEGSTIEISCDGPLRAPYTCYLQGGVNFTAGRAAVLNAVQKAFFA